MAIDFSWIITALNNIATNITDFFSSLWTEAQNIVNTGQGLYAGLVNFGGWLYQGLRDAYDSLSAGLKVIGDAFSQIGDAFLSGWNYLSENLFAFGTALWSGIQGFANAIVLNISSMFNSIYAFLSDVAVSFFTTVSDFKTATDTWYANLMIGIRNKMKASILFSVTTHIAWNSMARIPKAKSLMDFGYALGGIILAPIPAFLISELLDVLIPIPTTTTFKVAPDLGSISITPPTVTPDVSWPPSPSAPPSGPFTGVSERTLIIGLNYDVNYMVGQDATLDIGLSYEVSVA